MSAPEPLLNRILRIFTQKTNAALNRLDDPAEAIDIVIGDQLESINRARADLAAVATAEKRLSILSQEFEQRAARHIAEARTAIANGEPEAARVSARRAIEAERLSNDVVAQIQDVRVQVTELEQLIDQMRSNYDRLRVRRESVAAQTASARATVESNESLTALGEGAKREAELERARGALTDLRARAQAVTDLRKRGSLDAVGASEFDCRPLVTDSDVERRIAELNNPSAPPSPRA